ncbi:MAG: RluA family pseudouridine synthase [Candidatus Eisenbacteria bacterium]
MSPSDGRLCLTVDEESEGTRIDLFLAQRLEDVSRSRIQQLIRDGQVLLNDAACRPSTPVKEGQTISWPADAGVTLVTLQPEPIPIRAVFEDEDLLVLDKQPDLVVHPAPGHWSGTLVNGLLHRWPDWRAPGGADRPGIVHRLDKDTSGLMVVARSARAFRSLSEQIAAHDVERAYIALAWGVVEGERGEVDAPIGRDPQHRQRMAVVAQGGRPARTAWQVLWRFDRLTLVRLVLRTGRTHQVRVHLASLGHPVFGDPVYGSGVEGPSLPPGERVRCRRWLQELGRLALHAYRLGFRHPEDQEWLAFEAPVPKDMEQVLLDLYQPGGA